jgi:hypothetical protein
MPNDDIIVNIRKAISPAIGLGISQTLTICRAVASSVKPVNKRFHPPENFI